MATPQAWIDFAERELVVSKIGLRDSTIVRITFYHTYICAEHAIKGYLVFKNQSVYEKEDLIVLLNRCIEFDAEFKELAPIATDLNPYSSATQYPDDSFVIPGLGVAQECIEKAERVLEFVKSKIRPKKRKFTALNIKTKGFKFSRDEANER